MWQDGPPNERKIVTLCEYAVKNLVRSPKVWSLNLLFYLCLPVKVTFIEISEPSAEYFWYFFKQIAKYLEERCYKELRVEHIKFINIVWERFTRLVAEVKAAKIERDNARQMETEALERERIAKRRSEKYRVTARIAEEKVHKLGLL